MYYDANPQKRVNEFINNIYKSLLLWIDNHPGCVVNDIKIHLDLLIKERERHQEEEREKYRYNGQTKKH